MKKENEQGFARYHLESGFAAVLIMLILVGIVAIVGASYFFGVNKIGKNIATPTPNVSPSPIASQATTGDMTNWKTLTLLNNSVSVKYPDTIYLEKNDSDNFAIALSYKGASQMNGGFRIEAQFTEPYADFTQAIKETEIYFKPYTNFKKQILQNGIVKMSGVLDTDVRVIALADYKGKAIAFDYLSQREKVTPEIFDQILSTFKFTSSTSIIPKPISDLFNSINTKFNINLVPVEENEFYTTTGMISKKSWKIDFVNTNLGKGLTTFLYSQLAANMLESAGGAGGGVDAYENSQIKCNHIYGFKSGDPINWKDPFNYLSCTEK